MNVYVKFISLP